MSSRPSRGAARLASILDALPDALLLVDVNGTVVNANAIALETFESPGTALVGRGLLDLIPDFDPKRIPGSMRSPHEASQDTRTKPTRMIARRTDGSQFPVEVTSANLEGGRTPYADYGDGVPHYTGDELLMLVVRDLQHTVDTEAELARQQRQTEMILRAAAEGVVGVDTAGKIVLVNPSAAQILGHRATDLGGKELHPLVHHSRPDGSPLAYEETPLADTLRSGRKHRVRGQVLWRKDGSAVPVDLTTAPVRDGEQLVGAVMTFTDRTAQDALAARNRQLSALLDISLRGPLAELRAELTGLAADPAGQLWPEANQILHHLAAGYARITTLIDNVLAFQRLDRGEDKLQRTETSFDEVVNAAVEGAVELIGPGRAQYAVHAPPIMVQVDGPRMAQALAHLIADVAGVDSAGNATAHSGDSTIVVAAARRGDVVRIDVRGPHAGGDPVHLPLARGIVERHGGVLQTHEVPGQGSAYVLEVPAGTPAPDSPGADSATSAAPAAAAGGSAGTAAKGAGTDSGAGTGKGTPAAPGSGARAHAGAHAEPGQKPHVPEAQRPAGEAGAEAAWAIPAAADQTEAPTGRRRALRRPGDDGRTPPGGTPEPEPVRPSGRRARRARPEGPEGGEGEGARPELPAPPIPNALPAAGGGPAEGTGRRARREIGPAAPPVPPQQGPADGPRPVPPPLPEGWPAAEQAPADASGRRAITHPEHGEHTDPAEPVGPGWPAAAGQNPAPRAPAAHNPPAQHPGGRNPAGQDGGAQGGPGGPVPPQPAGGWPAPAAPSPAAPAPAPAPAPGPAAPQNTGQNTGQGTGQGPHQNTGVPQGAGRNAGQPAGQGLPALPAQSSWPAAGQSAPPRGVSPIPTTPSTPATRAPAASAAPQEHAAGGHSRAISVRTLGQGVPFSSDPHAPQTPTQAVQAQHPQGLPAQVAAGGSGRRRRLAPPPRTEPQAEPQAQPQAPPQAQPQQPPRPQPQQPPEAQPQAQPGPQPHVPAQGGEPQGGPRAVAGPGADQAAAGLQEDGRPLPVPPPVPVPETDGAPGRSYAIGAPAAGAAEGPEPLDGPGGAVDVTDLADAPDGADDHMEEPLDEPRRLLVWPEPDVSTRQALTDRGYRPVIVRSREEVDAQVAEPPAALFVDPLTGPITRTALQSLRQAAAAAQVPVLVTAGLGQATREAAYGADPAVLLKALAPRDSEQHPPRVLLVESHQAIAQAFAVTLERRGMQVTHADSEADAMTKAAQMHPNLVVMDLMLIRRRRQGIVDWLRGNARLDLTPLVVYTSADIDPAELPRLASGETVLFLAERSTSPDVQSRIVDLLGKIGG
ncbi:PAS domain-containing protein [Streptomyces sp. HPF1205]|uniref:PAS domain-containing protein n=1 Tax=Streptomyces sp. HPF1205 TaxID=2873262 RepID=UPI001CEDDF23|nr:PAS domain-containing protein [Streptomyces sp. HPF1205]